MKVRLQDELALAAISPTALRGYLIYEGWTRSESYGEFAEIYVRPSDSKNELIIPVSTEISDYSSAVADAIRFLSKCENRDELAIYNDLTRADRDVIRVRAASADEDGSIEVNLGVEIVQHARDLLESGACAAFEVRRAYHAGKIQQAQSYMRRVRLGQTEHGSFVVNLLAPMPPSLSDVAQKSFWPQMEEEPYERKVTRVLAQALHSAHGAVVASNRGDGLRAFSGVVSKGVSANLCEAVAAIVDQADGADISITWAKTRPTPVQREQVHFSKADGEVLKEVARQFRLREPRLDERVIGYVTNLHRAEDESEGRITVKTVIDGKARSLSVELYRQDYETAVLAHKGQLPVTLIGDIEPEGQRLRLRDPRDIRIIGDELDSQ